MTKQKKINFNNRFKSEDKTVINNKPKKKTVKKKEFELDKDFENYITPEVWLYLNYLHSKIDVEWSGVIFYKKEGSPSDPENLKTTVIDFLLMDIGSAAYTEYETDDKVNDRWMDLILEHGTDIKIGHLHTH